MRLLSFALDVISTFLEIFCIYRYADVLFARRAEAPFWERRRYLYPALPILSSALLTLALNSVVLTSPYTVLAVMVQSILTMWAFWRCSLFDSAAVVGTYLFALSFSGNIEIAVIGLIGGEDLIYLTTMVQSGERAVYLILLSSYWFALNMLFVRWLEKRKIRMARSRRLAAISIAGLLGLSFLMRQMLVAFDTVPLILAYTFILIVSLCICSLYYKAQNDRLKGQMAAVSAQNEMLMERYQQLSDAYQANACLCHDMNHHLSAISRMADTEEVRNYIESLRNQPAAGSVPVRTGVDVLDVILSEMERKAEAKGVQIFFDVPALAQDPGMEKKDICALFANLLQNAVDAAATEIRFTLRPANRMLFIRVENDFTVRPVIRGGRPRPAGKDRNYHGWGTLSVEFVVEKYHGDIEYRIIGENRFRAELGVNLR